MKKLSPAKIYTSVQAAKMLGLTPGRIRQICREELIGEKHGRDWSLTMEDIELIGSLPDRRRK